MTTPTIAVVGASLAGAKAAEAARESGFEGRIVLIGDEPAAPYERPPLSKGILRGDQDRTAAQVHPDGYYEDHDIERVTDRATALDVTARTIELAAGDRLTFDTAILATGAAPRALYVPGAELDGVHYLRTIDDSVRLRDAIRAGGRVAVIGAGWIGSEVAASARQMGADVLLIDPALVPLQRTLGEEIGGVFRELHAANGVELRLGTGVKALQGSKTVEAVVLDDGSTVPVDVTVVGIGVTPRTGLAHASQRLSVNDGIVVDAHLQTDVEGIYAAGDVASAWHPRYRRHLRVEHWANALNQGLTAGRNAAGHHDTYDRIPYFFSDQYDLGLEYVGYAGPDDRLAVRGDLESREFIAFWHHEGVITAAMSVNIWDVLEDLKQLITTGRVVDPDRLTDPDVALGDLAGGRRG